MCNRLIISTFLCFQYNETMNITDNEWKSLSTKYINKQYLIFQPQHRYKKKLLLLVLILIYVSLRVSCNNNMILFVNVSIKIYSASELIQIILNKYADDEGSQIRILIIDFNDIVSNRYDIYVFKYHTEFSPWSFERNENIFHQYSFVNK